MTSENLNTIKYIFHTKYHQDVWEEFRTHEEVWNWIVKHEPRHEVLEPLKSDIRKVLTWNDEEIYQFIRTEADGFRLETPEEARTWLEKLNSFLGES